MRIKHKLYYFPENCLIENYTIQYDWNIYSCLSRKWSLQTIKKNQWIISLKLSHLTGGKVH